MSRKSAAHLSAKYFQSSIHGQRVNRAQKSTTSGTNQSDQSNMPKPEPMSIVDRSVLRSGLTYDSFVRLLIQSALGRLTIWTPFALRSSFFVTELTDDLSIAIVRKIQNRYGVEIWPWARTGLS
jgi:hypothetical protein